MKTLKNKILVILALAFAVCLMAISTAFIGTAKADAVTPPTLTMIDGASVRVDGTDVNGLRFAAGMSESDYGWFSENVGADKAYKDVQFGMFIAPANYLTDYADFTLGTLFGDNDATVKYDWAEWDNDAQKWVYSGDNGANGSPVRIINIKKSTLKEYKGQMAIIGAISDYEEYNIVKDFVGLGYYQLTDANDKVTNYLADYSESDKANNTRSMIEVVQTAMTDGSLVPEQVEQAKETYFDAIAENVSVKNKRISVVGSTTVAGNAYNGEMNTVDISDVVYTYNGVSTEFKLNDWTTQAQTFTVEGSTVKGIRFASGSVINAKYVDDLYLLADVYTPISSRADLDALGFDYLEDKVADKWALGTRYMLTNDIDYATDTSTYGSFRMNDSNDTVDLWDRYLIPIAATHRSIKANNAFNGTQIGKGEWGIFGAISHDTGFFQGVIDGAGFAIKNAVIPYGVSFSYESTQSGVLTNHASNFIGTLVYGGQLRNIAFTGLEFEDYTQIGGTNPYYSRDNEKIVGTTLESKLASKDYVVPASITNNIFGSMYFNPSNLTGLVGAMQNAVISNVYVEAAMKNGTFSRRAINGLIVAIIDKDVSPAGPSQGNLYSKVENCVVETSYYTYVGYTPKAEWIDWLIDYTGTQTTFTSLHNYNSGMGAIVGTSFLTDANAINNCFVIGNLQVRTDSNGSVFNPVTTIFSPGTSNDTTSGRHSSIIGLDLSTNCGLYASASALQEAQASVLANMSIAKYVG